VVLFAVRGRWLVENGACTIRWHDSLTMRDTKLREGRTLFPAHPLGGGISVRIFRARCAMLGC
jgi:hypothetical protein